MQMRATHSTHPRIDDIWGERTPMDGRQSWPAGVDELLTPGVEAVMVERWVGSA